LQSGSIGSSYDLEGVVVRTATVKHRLDEFVVVENSAVLPSCVENLKARYSYLWLMKAGFTTFEATAQVATFFKLPLPDVRFAGLKDEDAMTSQVISISAATPSHDSLELFNQQHMHDGTRYLNLRQYGVGDERIGAGFLNGNSFRIVVRNLEESFAKKLFKSERLAVPFLNYYDLQRFGTPGGTKTNHLIGKALVEGELDAALELLRQSRSPESESAIEFSGSAEMFFASLDARLVAFFKSAYSSYLWNSELARVASLANDSEIYVEVNGQIEYVFSSTINTITDIERRQRKLPFQRFGESRSEVKRPTVVHVQLICNGIEADESGDGSYKCTLSFFLPAGSYATMMARQLPRLTDLFD
jgi:tRNA pseudouridine13 synthase